MAKKVKLFKHKARKSRAEVSEFLGQLSQKIADGEVILRQTPEDIVLAMPPHMNLNVKANKKHKRVKGTRHTLTLKLTWYEDDHQDDPLALG
jgi:amphi-Trp domain-containing protein